MLSIVLQRPDAARARPRDYIKKTTNYCEVFGPDKYSLTLYLKTTAICRRIAEYLEQRSLETIHKRNINFYLCMYVCCDLTESAYADPGKIQKIDIEKLTDEELGRCYSRVWKEYEKIAEKQEGDDGERDYDLVAKGPVLLKAVQTNLRRRFNRKKASGKRR
jgi:hypothetical protein